jgi:hypothetical protein
MDNPISMISLNFVIINAPRIKMASFELNDVKHTRFINHERNVINGGLFHAGINSHVATVILF